MQRSELTKIVAERTGINYKDVVLVISTFINVINESVLNGINVSIKGLCVFKIVERDPYVAKNPLTGKKVNVPARYVLKIQVPTRMKRAFKLKKVYRG